MSASPLISCIVCSSLSCRIPPALLRHLAPLKEALLTINYHQLLLQEGVVLNMSSSTRPAGGGGSTGISYGDEGLPDSWMMDYEEVRGGEASFGIVTVFLLLHRVGPLFQQKWLKTRELFMQISSTVMYTQIHTQQLSKQTLHM